VHPENETRKLVGFRLQEELMKRTKDGRRQFSREFKVEAVRRIENGEKPSVVAQSLGVKMEVIGRWRQVVRKAGEQALRGVGRPKGVRKRGTPFGQGKSRIEDLERLVGRQQAAIDFLEQALHQVEALRQPKKGNGGTASSK
jgi:transposase